MKLSVKDVRLSLKQKGNANQHNLMLMPNLYLAQRESEAVKIEADAQAYAVRVTAEAIEKDGQAAVDF